jgi:hypothetical protein
MSLEAVNHLPVFCLGGRRLIDDNDIQPGQYCLVLPKGLSDYSFDPISSRRPATVLL